MKVCNTSAQQDLHDKCLDTHGNKVITKQGHPPAWPLEPPDWSLTVCPVCGLRTPCTLRGQFAAFICFDSEF